MVGEHIRILKDGRWVHAIDCGDETVLHLAEHAPPPRVRRAYRPEFVAGAVAVEVVTHRERTFPSAEAVRRGYSRASDPALAAMFADSEAFVEWCLTGRVAAQRNVALDVPGVPSAGAADASPSAPARSARRTGQAAPKRKPATKKAAKATTTRKPAAAKAKARAKPAKRAAKASARVKAKARPKAKPAPRTKPRPKVKKSK